MSTAIITNIVRGAASEACILLDGPEFLTAYKLAFEAYAGDFANVKAAYAAVNEFLENNF